MSLTPHRPLVLISWNGSEAPLRCLLADTTPQFDIVVFDYTARWVGTHNAPHALPNTLLSERTQCKGDIYQALARHLQATGLQPSFISLIDDDVLISVSDINRLLHLASYHGLHVSSAALSHDSHYTHRWSLRQPNRVLREVDWVEVMMPVYSGELFAACAPHFEGNVSSWGIDKYLVPTMQQLTGLTHTAIVDAVMASHVRPITSGETVYRNGLTAGQERDKMKQLCLGLIDQHKPELRQTDWFRRIFQQRHVRTRWQQLAYGLGRPIRRWLDQST
jgi:hypothetical protein